MPTKKPRYFAYTGSLIAPIFRYVSKAEIKVSPFDKSGSPLAEHYYRMFITIKKKYMQPDFEYSYAIDATTKNSKFGITFVNGWKQEFVLTNIIPHLMLRQVEYYNDIIELQRAMQGYDDEFDDEERHF